MKYSIDTAPRVPWVRAPGELCNARSSRWYGCTRPIGHGGRHAAGGGRRADGRIPIFEVWS